MTSTVKSILADVNVWLATLVAAHPHHEAATRWWRAEVVPTGDHVVFCRLTQLGLLRLLSNERVMGPNRMHHQQAWAAVRDVTAQANVSILEEPTGVDERLADLCSRRGSSPSFWSDAYLAAFALAGRHRVATFDRGFRRFEGLDVILLTEESDVPVPGP
jgi:toxin-antitoxin system PIN domain toxin